MTLRMTQNIFMPMKVNSSGISITLESVKIIRTEKCQQDSLNNHARVQEGWNAFLPAKISMLVRKMHHIAGQSYNNVVLSSLNVSYYCCVFSGCRTSGNLTWSTPVTGWMEVFVHFWNIWVRYEYLLILINKW